MKFSILFDDIFPSFCLLHDSSLITSKKNWGNRWNFYPLKRFLIVEVRGYMENATSFPNQAPIISYVLLNMCGAFHTVVVEHDFFKICQLLPLIFISCCLSASQNTQHFSNHTKLTADLFTILFSFRYGSSRFIMLRPFFFFR